MTGGQREQDEAAGWGVFDHIFAALAGEGPNPERIMLDALPSASHLIADLAVYIEDAEKKPRGKGYVKSLISPVFQPDSRAGAADRRYDGNAIATSTSQPPPPRS